MGVKKQKKMPDPIGGSFRFLISLLYFIVALIIMALGYLVLEDHIHAYLNPKTYTEKELKEIAMRATRASAEQNVDKIVDGIHLRTGFYADPNLKVVISSCTSCHSAKLVTQNKATRDGWQAMIKWMQATQGLPDLGKNEPIILDYLAKYYASKNTGRRQNIDVDAIEWYVLNLDS